MSVRDDVAAFRRKMEQRARDVHAVAADLVYQSIVEGSPVTGAPGQPVDTGNLKASWQNIVEGPLARRIVTNTAYAPFIEDGIGRSGPMTLRSQVGGFHSVKLTRAGWGNILRAALTEVTGGR